MSLFKGNVHVDNEDDVDLKKYKGIRYDFVLKFGDHLRIFLSKKQIMALRDSIEDILEK